MVFISRDSGRYPEPGDHEGVDDGGVQTALRHILQHEHLYCKQQPQGTVMVQGLGALLHSFGKEMK